MSSQSKTPHKLIPMGIGAVVGILIGSGVTFLVSGGGTGGADPVVASYNGKNIRASEAFAPIKTQLFDLEAQIFQSKEQAINETIEQKLVDAEARKQNLTIEQLLEKEAGGDVGDVSDDEINQFLSSKNLSLKDPRIKKDDVKEYLKYRRRYEKRQAFVSTLKKNANIKVLVAEPVAPKLVVDTEGYPTWGSPKAAVTIVEFSDFECPFCSRALPVLDQIKKEYGPDKVRIVFRDMPLPSHGRAIPAALASHCANEQGKFWEFHDALFGNQAALSDEDFKKHAVTLGMDAAKFNECFSKKKHMPIVDKSSREAASLGIQATPSFVINGTVIQGAQPFEKFKQLIDKGLAGKS
jgi:protein-disulfide isomerase